MQHSTFYRTGGKPTTLRNQHISRRLLGKPRLQLVLGVIADVRSWLSTRRANSVLRVGIRPVSTCRAHCTHKACLCGIILVPAGSLT
jgi:hypothetical protein